mmetsp:Transcript_3711/g.6674  ORF Transcript_3711/g.6674 Transcript_3711/m.6674 type:complete len:155 (+) Transcript_3711:80-544(+)
MSHPKAQEGDAEVSTQSVPAMAVIGAAVEPHCTAVGTPFCLKITLKGKVMRPAASWQVRFTADLVHHRIPLDLCIDDCSTSQEPSSTGEDDCIHVNLKVLGVPVSGLPTTALESLGILEARLMEAGEELAAVQLVTDVRRSGENWQQGVLDPFQ